MADIMDKLGIENPLFSARLLMNVYSGYQIRCINDQDNLQDDLRLQFDVVVSGLRKKKLFN